MFMLDLAVKMVWVVTKWSESVTETLHIMRPDRNCVDLGPSGTSLAVKHCTRASPVPRHTCTGNQLHFSCSAY